ncbi:MAG: tellurite resistance TerB family protein [Magnetococcales bacterium]|nr:tellurite resistance TerB family protein [Magnetococcales bacterium]
MGFFDDLKAKAQQMQSSVATEMTKFRNRDLMEAVMAGCALVAAADGNASSEEKQKMMGFIRNSEALKHYDMNVVINSFQQHIGKLEFDYALGKAEALKVISKIAKKTDESRLLVRVCCVIGASDGHFDDQEKKVVREICRELGLPPADFDL